jgi:hypothetical protein
VTSERIFFFLFSNSKYFLYNYTEIDSFLIGLRVAYLCESIYKAELSDTLHVSYQAPKDPHPWTALIMSIALGK